MQLGVRRAAISLSSSAIQPGNLHPSPPKEQRNSYAGWEMVAKSKSSRAVIRPEMGSNRRLFVAGR